MTKTLSVLVAALVVAMVAAPAVLAAPTTISLVPVGSYLSSSGAVEAATEIVSFDPKSKKAFSTNGVGNRIEVADLSNPASPVPLPAIDLSPYGSDVQSVAVRDGIVAAALKPLAPATAQDPGSVVFFKTDGTFIRQVTVGALPDMVAFNKTGNKLVVANEGEPACEEGNTPQEAVNPEGSVSIITVKTGKVVTADFRRFDSQKAALVASGVRLNWPGATVAQDLEPEYVAISGDRAWVTLQEANSIAVVDLEAGKVTKIIPLGTKDHSLAGNGLDPSDRDGVGATKNIAIVQRPVSGLYMPDGIASLGSEHGNFLITANEGDTRDYDCFADEARVSSSGIVLDPSAYPNGATLKGDGPDGIGRLTVSTTDGDTGNDGDIDRLHSFGARSFSIFKPNGSLVFDSGDLLERTIAAELPAVFNSDGDSTATFDTRSDNKGPEPESVAVGTAYGRLLGFVGLERVGGIVTVDLSKPQNPAFLDYVNPRFDGFGVGNSDRAPEGLQFVAAKDSPNNVPLVLSANERSGTVTIFEVRKNSL